MGREADDSRGGDHAGSDHGRNTVARLPYVPFQRPDAIGRTDRRDQRALVIAGEGGEQGEHQAPRKDGVPPPAGRSAGDALWSCRRSPQFVNSEATLRRPSRVAVGQAGVCHLAGCPADEGAPSEAPHLPNEGAFPQASVSASPRPFPATSFSTEIRRRVRIVASIRAACSGMHKQHSATTPGAWMLRRSLDICDWGNP
jgi:hypothetical protein